MIRILIADDHIIIRDGLKAMLAEANEIEIAGDVENGKAVLEFLKSDTVDVVLMDISMPVMDGIEATKYITANFPETKVLALTIHEQHEYIRYMMKAGARGYVLKDAGKAELQLAIFNASKGKKYMSEKVAGKFTSTEPNPNDHLITEREKDILKMIAGELTNQEIATKLSLSVRTVDTHRRNLMQKLSVKNTAGLVKYAYSMGLI